jgi:hypothetical protein
MTVIRAVAGHAHERHEIAHAPAKASFASRHRRAAIGVCLARKPGASAPRPVAAARARSTRASARSACVASIGAARRSARSGAARGGLSAATTSHGPGHAGAGGSAACNAPRARGYATTRAGASRARSAARRLAAGRACFWGDRAGSGAAVGGPARLSVLHAVGAAERKEGQPDESAERHY